MTTKRMVRVQVTDSANTGRRVPVEQDLNLSYEGVGTIPSAAAALGVSVAERGGPVVHQSVFTFSSVAMTVVDATTAGAHTALEFYDFPAGIITFLGATTNLTTLAGAGGIGDTAAVVGSVGTATNDTANATLTSTEADIVPSTTGTLTAGAGTLLGKSTSSQLVQFDGTSTAKKAFLNFAVPDAGSSADDTLTVSGTITLSWINSGDN